MKISKKVLAVLLMAALGAGLVSCGSSGGAQQSSESVEQTEDVKIDSETSEETTAPGGEETAGEEAADEGTADEESASEPAGTAAEYLEPADAAAPGHFSDPDAFKGFDSYQAQYNTDIFKDKYSDAEVTFGETVLKDHYKGEIFDTSQFADKTHAAVKKPEKLEAGAVGLVTTDSANSQGMAVNYVVYNPTDDAAAFEDCPIIGFEETHARSIEFSNGASFVIAGGDAGVSNTDPREAIIAALGEPYETEGDISESSDRAYYSWRDESGKHILKIEIWGSDGHFQTLSITCKNFETVVD